MTTHIDKGHIHNHIIFCAVDFLFAVAGLLSILASVSFTLFLSAGCKSTVSSWQYPARQRSLLLGSVCFAISYGLELALFILQGNPAHLELYISSFSLTGSQIKKTDFVFFLLCVLFNVMNVWMEEGVFRGLFLKMFSETKSFMKANYIAAFLFGVWHIVMPVRSYINGEMTFAAMLLMGIGYMILAGIMAAQIISFAIVLAIHTYRTAKVR